MGLTVPPMPPRSQLSQLVWSPDRRFVEITEIGGRVSRVWIEPEDEFAGRADLFIERMNLDLQLAMQRPALGHLESQRPHRPTHCASCGAPAQPHESSCSYCLSALGQTMARARQPEPEVR